MSAAYICGGVRTAIGRYGGSLSKLRADDLAATSIRALLERYPRIDPVAIDDVILGCANQAGEDNRNVARMAALLAGLPEKVPGVTVNRLCASGLDAVAAASRIIRSGEGDLLIAGGVESMSRAPLVMPKAENRFFLGVRRFTTQLLVGDLSTNACENSLAWIQCPRRRKTSPGIMGSLVKIRTNSH